jgi:hypothetical protein
VVAFCPGSHEQCVTLDYVDATDFRRQHYAFLVGEREFEAALSRIKSSGITFYADFNRAGLGDINHLYCGRLVFRRPRRPFAGNHHPAIRAYARKVGGEFRLRERLALAMASSLIS